LLVTKLASAYHDAAGGTVDLTVIYDEGRQGEPTRRWIRHDRLRLVGAEELRSFAEDAGLTVEVLAGGYDLAPISSGDDRAILLARRPIAGPKRTRQRPAGATGTRPTGSAVQTGLV